MEAPLVKEESSSRVSAFKSPRFADLPSPRKPSSPDASLRGRSLSAEDKALAKLDSERVGEKKSHSRTNSGGQGSRLDGPRDEDQTRRRAGTGSSAHSAHKQERRGLEHSDGVAEREKRTYYRQHSHGHLTSHGVEKDRIKDSKKPQDDSVLGKPASRVSPGRRGDRVDRHVDQERRSNTPEHRREREVKENITPAQTSSPAGSDIVKKEKEREKEKEKEKEKEREKEREKEKEKEKEKERERRIASPHIRLEISNPIVRQLRVSERDSVSSSLGSEGIAESTPSFSESDELSKHKSLSPREARILSLEAVARLRRDMEEALVELEKQRELELKVEEKWSQGTMGLKLKELKKKALDKTLDQTSIGEEQRKLKAIRDITHQRMKETTRKLEARISALKENLTSLERTLHTQYKNLQPQMLQQNRHRIERLIQRRPSIENLIYRGIYVPDPTVKRRSRDIAKEKLDEMFTARRRSSGSYSASWMFGSEESSESKFSHSSSPNTDMRRLSTIERKTQEFLELLTKEKCIINYAELQDPVLVSEGAFSWVFKATWRGMVVAVKKLKPRENMLRIAQAEVLCMLLTKANPHTINILGACLEPVCIVVPYYENGSLFDLIHKKRSKLSYERILQIARDVALGCQQLHSMRPPLMHRDLTTNNVLLDEKGGALIIDFGISREETTDVPTQLSPIGHPRLRAPEITNRQPYTKSVDVYNFGTLLYELVVARLPFDDLPDQEAAYCTSKGLLPPLAADVPKSMRKLITSCWSVPESRPSFKQIVFKLNKMDERVQERRLTAQEQNHAPNPSRREEALKGSKERPQ